MLLALKPYSAKYMLNPKPDICMQLKELLTQPLRHLLSDATKEDTTWKKNAGCTTKRTQTLLSIAGGFSKKLSILQTLVKTHIYRGGSIK